MSFNLLYFFICGQLSDDFTKWMCLCDRCVCKKKKKKHSADTTRSTGKSCCRGLNMTEYYFKLFSLPVICIFSTFTFTTFRFVSSQLGHIQTSNSSALNTRALHSFQWDHGICGDLLLLAKINVQNIQLAVSNVYPVQTVTFAGENDGRSYQLLLINIKSMRDLMAGPN